jgi:ABC-type dipeptide/oligopeptide/nickel transport system ATPase subunit
VEHLSREAVLKDICFSAYTGEILGIAGLVGAGRTELVKAKTHWGHQEEFLDLFKRNHYPVLQKEIAQGRILSVRLDTPAYHMPEQERWDYRVTIVFKNAQAAYTPVDEHAIQLQLFPDQTTFKREEQRRFEILEAHWDLSISQIPLDKK